MTHPLTPRQQKFVDAAKREGEAWYVPAQAKMVYFLRDLGLLEITNETRFNGPRAARERKVVPR